MKTNSIKLLAVLFLFISCGKEQTRPKTPEELRAELKQQELTHPLDYLEDKDVKLKPQIKKIRNAGLFRDAEYAEDGALIEGFFINKSTLGKFKDIEVKVTYNSQTETIIDEKSYIFYEFYEPNSTKPFSIKVNPPKAYKTFSFHITNAKGVFE